MSKIIELIDKAWHRKAPANEIEITEIEKKLAVKFPTDYIELLKWSNGGEAKIGSAYFSIWPIQDIPHRNISASISKYMTNKFIGIGTNGGDECYALDYTINATPDFAIVPLGDLGHESKFIISSTLTEGIQKAIDGQFDDGEYNALPGGKLTDELMNIRMTNLRIEAEKAWQQKAYEKYVDLFNDVQDRLTPVELKKLVFARSRE